MAAGTRTYQHNINAGGDVAHRSLEDLITWLRKVNAENVETYDLTITATTTQGAA